MTMNCAAAMSARPSHRRLAGAIAVDMICSPSGEYPMGV
jgi:hypothetical protein